MLAYDWNFLGLSTETKPLSGEKVVDGSTFYECDTSTFFIYYQGKWYQQTFVTEDGINFWLYKALMKKMFGKWFDGNISLGKVIKPTTGTEIEFTNSLPAQITDLTGYGDTSQQTYSGKNLSSTINVSGNMQITGLNSFVGDRDNGRTENVYFSPRLPAGTYTISYDVEKNATNTEGIKCGIYVVDGSGTIGLANLPDYTGHIEYTFTSTTEVDRLYFFISNNMPSGSTATVTNLQVESGSTATSFEPYVGGTASPNPDYPQNVQVVTGEQTITIIDGTNSQNYTVDLGLTELCKLGDYQDYIYKTGDDWYVHKACGKVVFDGSDDEGWVYNSNSAQPFRILFTDAAQFTPSQNIPPSVIVNYYTPYYWNISPKPDYGVTAAADDVGAKILCFRNIDITSLVNWRTWLGSNNTIVYYRLATPTDTKITDTTLISNLNSLLNYMFPAGDHQIVITADGLPMALKLTITEKE